MTQKDAWDLQSKTIDWLRFPLIIMVVFIHNKDLGNIPDPINVWNIDSLSTIDCINLIKIAFSLVIPRIAVPSFFLISGYLFFFHVSEWNKSVYKQKLRKRVYTLLIPYILWNMIQLVMPIICNYSLGWHNPQYYLDVNKYISSVDWIHWIWDFSFNNQYGVVNGLGIVHDLTYPINGPLWYVRDLLVLCLLTPVIYWFIIKVGRIYVASLCLLYVLDIWPNIHGLGLTSMFFFNIGSFFALNKINIVLLFKRIEVPCFLIALILLCFLIPNSNSYKIGVINMSVFYIMAGVVSVFNIAHRILLFGRVGVNKWLTNSVFFIFAFHTNCLLDHIRVIYPDGSGTIITLIKYLSMPFVKIAMCLIVYWLMERYCSRLLKILTGNR